MGAFAPLIISLDPALKTRLLYQNFSFVQHWKLFLTENLPNIKGLPSCSLRSSVH